MTHKKARSIERVLDVAALAFTRQRFEEVSINWIAEEAHCSTATIYDVFGSKEELYRSAAARLLDSLPAPRIKPFDGKPILFPLLDYSEQRLRFISAPERGRADQLLIGRIDVTGDLLSDTVEREIGYMNETIGREVDRCVMAGALRDIERSSMIYCISACTAHEPLTLSLYYRDSPVMDVGDILRKSFLPLVTPAGQGQLEVYLAQKPSRAVAADAA